MQRSEWSVSELSRNCPATPASTSFVEQGNAREVAGLVTDLNLTSQPPPNIRLATPRSTKMRKMIPADAITATISLSDRQSPIMLTSLS